jgi:hypothetical protein
MQEKIHGRMKFFSIFFSARRLAHRSIRLRNEATPLAALSHALAVARRRRGL